MIETRAVVSANPSAPRPAIRRTPAVVRRDRPQPPHRHRNFLWLAAVTLVAVGVVVVYRDAIGSRLQPAVSAATPTAEVRSGTVEQILRLAGTTVARNSVMLRAPYLRGRRSSGSGDFGLVLEQLAAPGSRVRQNDVVASFDRLAMLNRLDNYHASTADAKLQLKTTESEIAVERAAHAQLIRSARGEMDKAALDLKTAPVRSAIQAALFQLAYDEARAEYQSLVSRSRHLDDSFRAAIRLAQLQLAEEQVEQRRAEANVDRMVVRAPVAGLVVVNETFRGSEFGQIQAGDQLRPGRPYMQIVDPASLIVEATANQIDVEDLRIGDRARVQFDAFSNLELPARVYSIGPLATPRRWRPDYVSEVSIFLKLERMDPRLIPNLSASADVILESGPASGIVPRQAVFHDAGTGQPFAYVRTDSGWETRDLELGIQNHVEAAVRSGLTEGETVALAEPAE